MLIAITAVWGCTFLIVQHALNTSGAFYFVSLRFGAAAILLALLTGRTLRGITWGELRAGGLIGLAIALGYSLQTIGLETILSSKSAFITALYVPLVPLLQWVVLRRPPGIMAWTGAGLAFIGLALLAGPEGTSAEIGFGEVVTLLCAVACAWEILLIGKFAGQVDSRRVTVVQLAAASIFAGAAGLFSGEAAPTPSWLLVATVLGLAVASAGIQLGMNWAQNYVSPTKATVIYAGEPVWAAFFGRLAGEILTPRAIAGAALILMAILISEWKPRRADASFRDDEQ